jgi:cytochrome c biogenesis protein CcmG/thiol:disulfide interchange protein DsbE
MASPILPGPDGAGQGLGRPRERSSAGRLRTLLVTAATGAIILLVAYLADRPASGGSFTSVVLSGGASGPAPEVGKPAPDFTATTIEGAKVTLSRLRGHPVWLTFGAPWCQPCRAENPDVEAAYEQHRAQGLKVLAVFIQDSRSDIEEYAQRTGLTYAKVDDSSGRIASSYRIVGIPSHFFIDSTGILREIRISSLDPSAMNEDLAQIGVDVARQAG